MKKILSLFLAIMMMVAAFSGCSDEKTEENNSKLEIEGEDEGGITVSGGEPLLQKDIIAFIKKIKDMGFSVKLDTNGAYPKKLKDLVNKGLIDYVAMDIKTCKERYPDVIGIPSANIGSIMESVEFLKQGTVPYEFRTTVVKELHSAEDFARIGEWISGCPNYFLQNYVDSENVLVSGFSSCSKEELLSFRDIVKSYVGHVELRGVDY